MIPHINHPNFGYGISLDDMIALKGERFFEVYNGHPSVHNLGDSVHISTEEMWDRINISYIENNQGHSNWVSLGSWWAISWRPARLLVRATSLWF